MADPFVVVGGDAAGLSAASKFRRENPDGDVIVFEKGQWISYAYCGMPYFIEGRVDHIADLLSLSPAAVSDRGIDLRRGHEVIDVAPADHVLTVRTAEGTFEQQYSTLLVATGGHAVTGPLDVTDLDGAFTLHDMDSAAAVDAYIAEPASYNFGRVAIEHVDSDRVRHNASLSAPETAAIVGGGYVGIEMAEALTGRNLDVHLFQRSDHVLPDFGSVVASRVEDELEKKGVTVHTDRPVSSLEGDGRIQEITFDGQRLAVDMAIVGVGIRPNVDLLSDTDVDLGPGNAILTDKYGRTNLPDIYAAGDCATAINTVTGEPQWLPLGLTANRFGRSIGATVAGDLTPVGEIAGTAMLKAFDMECARVGLLDDAVAIEAGFDPVRKTVTARSRSGYYPGAAETDVTLVADRKSGQLLGGSIVGADRAAIRIDTVATALENDMTVPEIERLDLGYAPPFSPVWDPILVAAKVLNGELEN